MWLLPVLIQPRFLADLKPQLDSHTPASIDLAIRGEQIATLTNTGPLLSLLRVGRHVRPHRCSFQGKLTFRYPDGHDASVAILPGHTNVNYEFVCTNGYYAVPRAAFLSVLASAGIDTNQIPMK